MNNQNSNNNDDHEIQEALLNEIEFDNTDNELFDDPIIIDGIYIEPDIM